jgi:alpha-beta hydrolase superfamily lysophospholipase
MIAFRDELLCAQLLRTLGHATYGAAEIGECIATARTIDPRERESWFRAWMALGDRTRVTADAATAIGDEASARGAYLRASNYYRNAYVLHLEAPLPQQVREAYAKHVDSFRRANVATPWDAPGAEANAYFVSGGAGRRGVVVSVGGYDSTAEESYLWNAAAAAARGYHAVMFDGPGQGAQLMRGVPFTPAWSFADVLDAVAARPDVDPTRIVVIGESFGGYLAPLTAARATAGAMIAALVLDPAQISLAEATRERIPGPLRVHFERSRVLRFLIERRARGLTSGWALRRGALVHGVEGPFAYLCETQRYTGGDLAAIRCPTLVCDAESDEIAASARAFYDRLTCPKSYMRFTDVEGAGTHCISGNRALFHARVFGWVAAQLAPTSDVRAHDLAIPASNDG